jgi:hypothetical protein
MISEVVILTLEFDANVLLELWSKVVMNPLNFIYAILSVFFLITKILT